MENLLTKLVTQSAGFKKLLRNITNRRTSYATGLTGAARTFFAAKMLESIDKPVLVVVPDIATAIKYTRDINTFSDKQAVFLPSQEASPYEQVYSDPEVTKQQLNALNLFMEQGGEAPCSTVIVTPAKNLMTKFLPKSMAETHSITLALKSKADLLYISQ